MLDIEWELQILSCKSAIIVILNHIEHIHTAAIFIWCHIQGGKIKCRSPTAVSPICKSFKSRESDKLL